MKIPNRLFAYLTLAILTFTGCHELGHYDDRGSYGGSYGGGYAGSSADIRGRVTTNTPAYNSIAMDTRNGQYVFVYDGQTQVRYRNSNYPIQNIQPGDELSVIARPNASGSFPTADVVTVMSRVSGSGSGSGSIGATVHGRVTSNTPGYNSIAINTPNGQYVFVHDAQTQVRYRNSNYPIQNIQAGDELSVVARPNTSGSFPVADVITVTSRR